jgi:hypothetical protein
MATDEQREAEREKVIEGLIEYHGLDRERAERVMDLADVMRRRAPTVEDLQEALRRG